MAVYAQLFYGWWWWWWWLILGLLTLIGLWWLLVVWPRSRRPPGAGRGPEETLAERDRARLILDERYARGEITREQYEQMRRDIENRNAA